jgi:hypothetical protein
VAAALYAGFTGEGQAVLAQLRAISTPEDFGSPAIKLPTPPPDRPATIHWLASDGLWSAQDHNVTAGMPDRIEQLSNLVLDRLGLDLLVVQAFVGEDDVAYLFFSVSTWEPSANEESSLVESLVRSILSDLPWLRGVRLVLPNRHLDYGQPVSHFDRGQDPLVRKTRSTSALEVAP